MKLIPLTQRYVAKVDDEDYDFLMQWKWVAHKNKWDIVYARRGQYNPETKRNKTILLHRVIMKAVKGEIIDHADHDGLNCQKYNMRKCTTVENSRNRNAKKKSTSKYIGVSWHRASKKWVSQIHVNGKQIHIGCFNSESEAAMKYDEAAKENFKAFANLNFKQ